MIYTINWDDVEVARTEKVDRHYISSVDKDGYTYAIKGGLMRGLLSCVKIESSELPIFITRRVPGYEHLTEDEVINFIKETECRVVTDKISIKVIEQ